MIDTARIYLLMQSVIFLDLDHSYTKAEAKAINFGNFSLFKEQFLSATLRIRRQMREKNPGFDYTPQERTWLVLKRYANRLWDLKGEDLFHPASLMKYSHEDLRRYITDAIQYGFVMKNANILLGESKVISDNETKCGSAVKTPIASAEISNYSLPFYEERILWSYGVKISNLSDEALIMHIQRTEDAVAKLKQTKAVSTKVKALIEQNNSHIKNLVAELDKRK